MYLLEAKSSLRRASHDCGVRHRLDGCSFVSSLVSTFTKVLLHPLLALAAQ